MRSTMQDSPLSVARILQHGAATHARSSVITWGPDGSARRSFAEVAGDAARLAHALRRLGVDGDQRIATYMANNAAHVVAYLAVPSMGAVLHPLNIRLHASEVAWIANHAADDVVVVDAALLESFATVLPQLRTVRHVVVHGDADVSALAAVAPSGVAFHDYASLLAAEPDTFAWPVPDERDAAALCYTSGTTGHPRGVAYSHRSIWLHSLQLLTAEAYGLSDADTALVIVPQFHAMAWGFPYSAFMSGCSLLMPDGHLDAASVLAMIESERPTYAAAVPAVWIPVLELADQVRPDLSSLREVAIGGAACPAWLFDAYEQRHGVRLVHAWGMTEISPYGAVARPPGYARTADEQQPYRVSQGRLPASVEGRLVGVDGAVLPSDGETVGELEVRGPWVTASYLRAADGSDEAEDRARDAAAFHDGWLRTGDVGTLTPDGYLTLTDRAKDVIKSGGEWISSVALENALAEHPAVREAAVIAVPDERWGERPLAVVVAAHGSAPLDPADLREHLAPAFVAWQLPDHWAFVDQLPRTSTGKVDKVALRAARAGGDLAVHPTTA